MSDKTINLIYILGTPYSGTTLLGFLLGSIKETEFLGELKFYTRLKERTVKKVDGLCTCGKDARNCLIWSELLNKTSITLFETPNLFQAVGIILKTIIGLPFSTFKSKSTQEGRSLNSILQTIKDKNPHASHLVDSSKFIFRLSHLIRCPDVDLSVVYIKRNFSDNVASFIERGKSFWLGAGVYLIYHSLFRKFLQTNQVKYKIINYLKLCQKPEETLKELDAFLNLNYKDYQQVLKKKKFHVATGNWGTRKQFRLRFKKIKYDNSWETRLNKYQIKVLNLITNIL